MAAAGFLDRARTEARVDLAPDGDPPPTLRVALATVVSIVASLAADAVLVQAGTALWPSTTGYPHFAFSDYSVLTVIGVVAAGLAWPVVTRITSQPRWLLLRLAIVVSVVLLLPDAWLLATGQPAEAVAVLAAMHLAIALITYNMLVHLAPAGARPGAPSPSPGSPAATTAGTDSPATGPSRPTAGPSRPPAGTDRTATGTDRPTAGPSRPPAGTALRARERSDRWPNAVWATMAGLLGLESLLGLAALVVVPASRPDSWIPTTGEAVYVAHAIVGLVLGLGAAVLLLVHLRRDRLSRTSALVGLAGTALAGVGGLLTVDKPVRFVGIALMLVGALVAVFAYLVPVGFADDDLPTVPLPVPAAGDGEWDDDREHPLACTRRHPTAAETRQWRSPDLDAEAWAAVCLAAGSCPLCPDKLLRPIGSRWICGCCETIYRRLPDDADGAAWAAAPGQRVTRR